MHTASQPVSPRKCALHSDAEKQSRDEACTEGIPVWPRCRGGTGTGKEWKRGLLRKGGQIERQQWACKGADRSGTQYSGKMCGRWTRLTGRSKGGHVLDPVLLRINSAAILGKGKPRDLLGSGDRDSHCRSTSDQPKTPAEIRRTSEVT